MKVFKSILFLLLVFAFGLIVFACDLTPKELKITNAKEQMEIGEELELKVSIDSADITVTSSDDTIISCEGLKIKALKDGNVIITVKAGDLKATVSIAVVSSQYTVTFKGKGDTILASVKVKKGENATAPVVTDEAFDGWDKDFTNVQSDLVVNAKYKSEILHTVVFMDSKTEEVISVQEVKDGEAAVAPEITDALFIEWDQEFDNVKEDLIIYTVYGKSSKITYFLSGGSFENPEDKITSYIEGVELELKKPVKEGYSFNGWTKVKGGTDYIKVISANETGDISLYASWREKSILVEFDFNGCTSTEYFIAQKDKATATMYVDNYEYNGGAFWSSENYAKYSFIGTRNCDPGATFSDRIYIAKDSETGFYKIIKTLANGTGSSWPTGAEFVITVSSSYKAGSGFSGLHAQFGKLGDDVGHYVIFDGDFKEATLTNRVNVYIFKDLPTDTITVEMKKGDRLFTGLKVLGGTFEGWADPDGNIITSVDQIKEDEIKLTAQIKLENPVTAINVTSIPTEMLTGRTEQIVASVEPATAYFKQIFYSSSNTDVLTVSDSGLLTAVNAGTATITMVDYVKKIKVEKEITVYPINCIDVKFEGANGEEYNGILKVGGTVTIKPESYGKNLAQSSFTFVSSDPGVLTVSTSGVITAVANGKANVKITDSAVEGFEVNITVIVQDLTSEEKLDKVLALLAENNFAVVEAGNISLMDNGSKREYVSTYGSVNRYLFDPFVVDNTYKEVAKQTIASHDAGYNCKLRTDWHGGVEFVTVHDTATTTGTVQSIGNYMATGETSIHYTVGNDQILSVIPEEYIAYHAGDGTGTQFKWYDTGVAATDNSAPEFDMVQSGGKYYFVVNGVTTTIECPTGNGSRNIQNPSKKNFAHLGPVWKIENGKYYMGTTWVDFSQVAAGTIGSHGGNNNSIGIEMCVNYSGDIYDTWQRTAQLVADICLRHNLDLTRVKQHNTWTGKNCPQCLIAADYWWGFMKMVEINYILMKDYSDVEITMTSNDPRIVDNTGRVIAKPATTTTVSYTVTVKCGESTKSMTLYSVVPGTTTWEQWDGVYPSSKGWKWGE